jgi:outer membrane lipoprotein-sorting protein
MNMKSLRIEFTRKKYNLQRLVMVDAFDNETELSFSQVRLNAPIDDSVFDFQPPEGVEVIKPEGL